MKKGLLAVALLGLSLVAGGALAEPKPVIGALIRNLDDQFLGDYTGNLKKLAVSKGVELKVMDAHSDMATQLDQLNTLISQGVKYFVVVPAVTEGSEQLASIIAAKKGGAAFSNTAPTVAALKTLELDPAKVNVNGGSVALGHPIGASGCRLLVTLLHEMVRQNKKRGLVSLCLGGGEAVAMIVKR